MAERKDMSYNVRAIMRKIPYHNEKVTKKGGQNSRLYEFLFLQN
jgi:hypothetical protein